MNRTLTALIVVGLLALPTSASAQTPLQNLIKQLQMQATQQLFNNLQYPGQVSPEDAKAPEYNNLPQFFWQVINSRPTPKPISPN